MAETIPLQAESRIEDISQTGKEDQVRASLSSSYISGCNSYNDTLVLLSNFNRYHEDSQENQSKTLCSRRD